MAAFVCRSNLRRMASRIMLTRILASSCVCSGSFSSACRCDLGVVLLTGSVVHCSSALALPCRAPGFNTSAGAGFLRQGLQDIGQGLQDLGGSGGSERIGRHSHRGPQNHHTHQVPLQVASLSFMWLQFVPELQWVRFPFPSIRCLSLLSCSPHPCRSFPLPPLFPNRCRHEVQRGSPEPHVRTRFCYMGVQNLGAGL